MVNRCIYAHICSLGVFDLFSGYFLCSKLYNDCKLMGLGHYKYNSSNSELVADIVILRCATIIDRHGMGSSSFCVVDITLYFLLCC